MPIYIVRWANCSASIVRADDEDHLQALLDEVGDPGGAIWEEYDGPLWIELEPKRHQTESGSLELVSDYDADTVPSDILEPGIAAGETSAEMGWTIMARLFPHLYVALRHTAGSELPAAQVKAIIGDALTREQWHANACRERSQRYNGTNTIMGTLGLSVLPKHIGGAILNGLEQAKQAGRHIDDELMAMAAQQSDDITWRAAQHARLRAERQRAVEALEATGEALDELRETED